MDTEIWIPPGLPESELDSEELPSSEILVCNCSDNQRKNLHKIHWKILHSKVHDESLLKILQ